MLNNKYRTHMCGTIGEKEVGESVKIAGWVENIRDHGGVIFVDIRDMTGVIQTVSNDDSIFDGITRESSITLSGTIRKREEDDYNEEKNLFLDNEDEEDDLFVNIQKTKRKKTDDIEDFESLMNFNKMKLMSSRENLKDYKNIVKQIREKLKECAE